MHIKCMHSQKGTYNASFIPSALASYKHQITLQNPVSQIQSTEWNNTNITKSKWSGPKVYTSETIAICVLYTFDIKKQITLNL